MHNLRSYASHIIIKNAFEFNSQRENITQIVGNQISNEMFMTFSIGRLKLIGRFQFTSSSLDVLAVNLYGDQISGQQLHMNQARFPAKSISYATRGFTCTSGYMTKRRLEYVGLLASRALASLKQESIADDIYTHAHIVYNRNLISDVIRLASVFNNGIQFV